MQASDTALAQILWDYLRLDQPVEPGDAILCFGSHDTSVAKRGAELLLQGYAPWLVMSGGYGRITAGNFHRTEAEMFAEVAVTAGAPMEKILLEDKSSNSGENVLFSQKLLEERGVPVQKVIIVHKPYMERRALATFEAQWPKPQPEVIVTSPRISFEDYCKRLPEKQVINIMVGDLQRIHEYPKRGLQSEQNIPDEIRQAWEELVARGYTEHLLKQNDQGSI